MSDSNFEGRLWSNNSGQQEFRPIVAKLTAMLSTVDQNRPKSESDKIITRTELGSHANMAIIGRHSVIFDDTGQRCTVNAFSKSVGKLEKVPIVDTEIAYECPHKAKTIILLLRNALYIE